MSSKSALFNFLERLKTFMNSTRNILSDKNESSNKAAIPDLFSEGRKPDQPINISALNKSLCFANSSPILNAALALTGCQSDKICDAEIVFLVNSLLTILHSMIICKVVVNSPSYVLHKREKEHGVGETDDHVCERWFHNNLETSHNQCMEEQFLRLGTCLSVSDFSKIVDVSELVVENLYGNGEVFKSLMDALFRLALSISACQEQFLPYSRFYAKVKSGHMPHKRLISLLVQRGGNLKNRFNLPFRLQAWRVNSHLLKEDISSILKEAIERPLLCLKNEFQERDDWHSMILSFVTAPEIFSEARLLLHSWFLQTGIYRVLEVRTQLVASVFDALSRPNFWGVPLNVGLKLPFTHAFFCQRLQSLLSSLVAPLTFKNLLKIVNFLEEIEPSEEFCQVDHSKMGLVVNRYYGSQSCSSRKMEAKTSSVDYNSPWALLLDFPNWFIFATVLLFNSDAVSNSESDAKFQHGDSALLNKQFAAQNNGEKGFCDSYQYYVSAKFLAWVLSPLESSHRDLVVSFLIKAAKDWKLWNLKLMNFKIQDSTRIVSDLASDLTCEVGSNKKRTAPWPAIESDAFDSRRKKVRVEASLKEYYSESFGKTGRHDGEISESYTAISTWLSEYSTQCRKLCNSMFPSKKICPSKESKQHNFFGECHSNSKDGRELTSSQRLDSEIWERQYAYLRRVPLGLFVANVLILDEYSSNLLLSFITTDEKFRLSQSSQVPILHEFDKNQLPKSQNIQNCASSSEGRAAEITMHTGELTHQTEASGNLISKLFQRNTNFIGMVGFLLNFLSISSSLTDSIRDTMNWEMIRSRVRTRVAKFIVICVRSLLEKGSFDSTLLDDLHQRLIHLTKNKEMSDITSSFVDLLQILDSKRLSKQL